MSILKWHRLLIPGGRPALLLAFLGMRESLHEQLEGPEEFRGTDVVVNGHTVYGWSSMNIARWGDGPRTT